MNANDFWLRRHAEFRERIKSLRYSKDPLKAEWQRKSLLWFKNSYHDLSLEELQVKLDAIDARELSSFRVQAQVTALMKKKAKVTREKRLKRLAEIDFWLKKKRERS